MTQIEAGNYQAKIVDYGIGATKSGDPQVMVLFEFSDAEGQRHELTWFGTLKEGKGQEITLKALLTCGMVGNEVENLAEGVLSNVLDVDTPVQIVVEREAGRDQSGSPTAQTYPRIKWINRLGGTAFANKLTKHDAKFKMSALNLKAAVMDMRQKTGVKDAPRVAQPAQTHKSNPDFMDANEDIGF